MCYKNTATGSSFDIDYIIEVKFFPELLEGSSG